MATYVLGDIQGCYRTLQALLERIAFSPPRDRLWLCGDLVNRGPASLEVLRWAHAQQDVLDIVLGNHDLHLLAVAWGIRRPRAGDTLGPILEAPERSTLLGWLGRQPLLRRAGPHLLVHAGLLPTWTPQEALRLAQTAEDALGGVDPEAFLRRLYGPKSELGEVHRAVEVLTRIRICTPAGAADLSFKGGLEQVPPGFFPWFRAPGRASAPARIFCGHWAALGLHQEPGVVALDSGCVWGRSLSAFRLEDGAIFQVPYQEGSALG